MPDTLNPTQRSYCMSRIRGKDTKPEILVRKGLHARGFRFRLQDRGLPGRPDIVLPKYGVAIMVNGCFWHGHKGCRYATRPKSNSEFWQAKIQRNKHRDEVTAAHLKPGLVGNLIGLAVVNNLCHFFSCHYIIVVLPTMIEDAN